MSEKIKNNSNNKKFLFDETDNSSSCQKTTGFNKNKNYSNCIQIQKSFEQKSPPTTTTTTTTTMTDNNKLEVQSTSKRKKLILCNLKENYDFNNDSENKLNIERSTNIATTTTMNYLIPDKNNLNFNSDDDAVGSSMDSQIDLKNDDDDDDDDDDNNGLDKANSPATISCKHGDIGTNSSSSNSGSYYDLDNSELSGAIGGEPAILGVTELLSRCSNPKICLKLSEICKLFNAPISEEQAWALIFQSIKLYRDLIKKDDYIIKNIRIPNGMSNFNVHNDGTVHISYQNNDEQCRVKSYKNIFKRFGILVFNALDYKTPEDESCFVSPELEQLISQMTLEDVDDEGIERDAEDECDDDKCIDTKDFDVIIEACSSRVRPSVPEDHYKAVCRALVSEALELSVFLQKVFNGDTECLRKKADAETSKQELDKLGFNDWARFWTQVVDELRRGVRLKKSDFPRTPVEFELTPYEILMEDIRTRKYNLRKVMVNGDIPPRVKKDAHAVILEFIRSRPPLKKASERKLPPPINRNRSPREQLMDSIRKGRPLKPVEQTTQTLKNRLLPPSTQQVENLKRDKRNDSDKSIDVQQSPRTKQRLIKVDFSLLQDDDDDMIIASGSASLQSSICSQPRMPPYPIAGAYTNNENNPNKMNTTVLRRTTYDLATQCESRRASMRRHTIVGCQSHTFKLNESSQSVPPSRPDSRQSEHSNTIVVNHKVTNSKPPSSAAAATTSRKISQQLNNDASIKNSTTNLTSMETWTKNSLDESQWTDKLSDRLSLTLEEIVHIRSVMTKAELEGLPVGVRVKEDVERKKICFLCLRTRFSIFGQWGILCKLCQRTVCSKCSTKMRIPTEHFRNVPVVLLSPSLMGSPAGSSTPSPSHHAQHNSGNLLDESFPKSLMERLLRSESDRKTRNSVGSAPSSPKNQRSNMSTPGSSITESNIIQSNINNNKENTNTYNGAMPSNKQVANVMSRSMEGPRSLPMHSPGRPHSNSSTLDRKYNRFRSFTSAHMAAEKEKICGELMSVCNDCRCLVLEIIKSSHQTRSLARNRALKNLTLDLSPVYK